MKRILKILIWCVIVISIAVAVYYVSTKQKQVLISDLSIEITYTGPDVFLKKQEIQDIIEKQTGGLFEQTVSSINVKQIEEALLSNAYVNTVNVFVDMKGKMQVLIVQRQPIARIYSGKDSFYIDGYGKCMPLSDRYVSRVMLINGFMPSYTYEKLRDVDIVNIEGKNVLKDIFYLANFINRNKFLKALSEQVYVNSNKEFEIVPKIGKQIILVGDTSNLEQKFQKLELFYKHGIKQSGWDKYKSINLKFNNQIVCTKI